MDIRKARKAVPMTQEQLSEKIGVNRATLSKYETGQIEPSISMLRKICNALDCHLSDIMTIDEMTGRLQHMLDGSEEFTKRTMERLESLRAEDEARGLESTRVVMEKMQADQAAFVASPVGRSIIYWFYELNELGQIEAEKRICELTEIPKYQRTAPTEPLADADPNTDTTE